METTVIQKFKNKLLRRKNKILAKCENIYNCAHFYSKDLFDKSFKECIAKMPITESPKVLQLHDVLYKAAVDAFPDALAKMFDSKIINEQVDLMTELEEIEFILSVLEEEKSEKVFSDYELLEKLLNKFGFTTEEKADVLIYFINKGIKVFENQDLEQEYALYKQFVLENTKEEFNDKNIFIKIMQDIANNEFRLRKFISEDGVLIPTKDSKEFESVLKSSKSDLTISQIETLVNVSLNRYQFNERKKELALKQEEIRTKKVIDQPIEDIKLANAKKRAAINKLKLYIANGEPIIKISLKSLDHILELMDIAGYTKKEIAIFKAKVEATVLKEQTMEQEQIHLAKAKEVLNKGQFRLYLEARALYIIKTDNYYLNEIREYVTYIESQINEIYAIQFESYKLENAKVLEEKEFLSLYIDELEQILISYKASSPELIRKRAEE